MRLLQVSCGRPMDLSWVDVELLLVPVAVVKDTPKCDDSILSDLHVSVNKFMETNTILWQFNAKFYTQDTTSTSTLCMSISATPTPSKSISDVLMNKKSVWPFS